MSMIYSLNQFTIMVWRFINIWTDPILEFNDHIAEVNSPLERKKISEKFKNFMNSEDLG